MHLFISIVIATYNRAQLVSEALASLSVQKNAETGADIHTLFEVIVVDNASKDNTQEVVNSWQTTLLNLRYLYESEQGVNYARNRGIAEARGEYVVFFDDECTVSSDYVYLLIDKLSLYQPALFGGAVYPRYHDMPPKPRWFRDDYGMFSVFDKTVPSAQIWLSGANMGGQRRLLQAMGGFSTQLGPKGERMVYGEEHELTERVRHALGMAAVYYFRESIVYHLVRPEKYSLAANLKEQCQRGYWRGMHSMALVQSSHLSAPKAINSQKKSLILELLKTPIFRNKQQYPYLQNYVIEVVAPFLRLVFVMLGKAHGYFDRVFRASA